MGFRPSTLATLSQPSLLVVGGSGFIGCHLLTAAQAKGWRGTSLSLNYPKKFREVSGVRYLVQDLCDFRATDKLLGGCDYDFVVNLSGYIDHKKFRDSGRELIDSHFDGLQNLIEILPRTRLKCFIQIGSSDEYGGARSPQAESIREEPISPYSLAKTAATHFIQMLNRTEEFPGVVLRLYLTYGPRQDTNRFIPQIIQGCIAREIFPVSEGTQLRDFCFVDDTIAAIFQTLQTPGACGEVINIASGRPVSIHNVIENVRCLAGGGRPEFGKISFRPGENMELYADISIAQELLCWKPRVPLEEGLWKTISWYQSNLE